MRLDTQGKVWYLKKFPVFEGLDGKQIAAMARFLEEKAVSKMQLVFGPEDEDRVFFIKKGMVEVYQLTADGKKIILETLGPGSFFGAVGAGVPQQNFLEAAEDTYLCVTSLDRLFEMMAEEPKVARQLVEGLFAQLFEARELIAVLVGGRVEDKLVHLLKLLVGKYGVRKNRGYEIAARFTHEDLAHMIGSSRETVTKTLGLLERQGLIERKDKQLVVLEKLLAGDGDGV